MNERDLKLYMQDRLFESSRNMQTAFAEGQESGDMTQYAAWLGIRNEINKMADYFDISLDQYGDPIENAIWGFQISGHA